MQFLEFQFIRLSLNFKNPFLSGCIIISTSIVQHVGPYDNVVFLIGLACRLIEFSIYRPTIKEIKNG